MIEQINTAVKFLAFFVANKVGKTGLIDVTVDVYDPAGSEIVTAGAASEIGDGLYAYTLAANLVATEGEYPAVFKTADATVDAKHIPALWVVGRGGIEDLDAAVTSRLAAGSYVAPPSVGTISSEVWNTAVAGHSVGSTGAKLDSIGTVDVTVLEPALVDGGLLTLVRGDDYKSQDGRALTFSSENWPDLTGAQITMTVRRRREAFGSGSDPILFSMSDTYALRTTSGTGNQTLIFEPTRTETINLIPGYTTAKWDIQAILATVGPSLSPSPSPSSGAPAGNVITLMVGMATVVEDQTR
jgi:hypothetical protein